MTLFWKESRFAAVVLPVVGFLALGLAPPAEAQSFQGLGDLAGGSFFSRANGVSADGSVVVGQSNSTSGVEAFRWTSVGGMVGLGDLPGGIFRSAATGVSADGSVVVGLGNSASGEEAFRWTSGGGMVGLGDLPGGIFQSQAVDVSADGSVVVGTSESASGPEAFRWTSGGGMVGLGRPARRECSESSRWCICRRVGCGGLEQYLRGPGSLPVDLGWRNGGSGRPARRE